MGFVILLFLTEVFGEVAENRRRIRRPAFECRDAARAAPAIAALHTDDNVLVEKSAFLQEPDCGFRSEFVGSELAYADEIAKPLCLLRLNQLQKRIQSVHFAFRWWLAILRQRLELGLHELAES